MDTVILAAGRGERLDGLTAPYHKPLLIVQGQPLITAAVDKARLAGSTRVIVVTAPENTLPISQVLGRREVTMVVQRYPDGPGDALLRGARAAWDDRLLVLMGDNTFELEELKRMARLDTSAVGVQQLPPEEASRFTYLNVKKGGWCEDGKPSQAATRVTVWCGPLLLWRQQAIDVLSRGSMSSNNELKIGPHLNDLLRDCTPMPSSSLDIGIPERLG